MGNNLSLRTIHINKSMDQQAIAKHQHILEYIEGSKGRFCHRICRSAFNDRQGDRKKKRKRGSVFSKKNLLKNGYPNRLTEVYISQPEN